MAPEVHDPLPDAIGYPATVLTDEDILAAVAQGFLFRKDGNFEPTSVRHCSYELRVGRYQILSPEIDRDGYYDPTGRPEGCVTLEPGETAKVWTLERLMLHPNVVGRVMIVGQISAAGIMAGAPIADPGWDSELYVTLYNMTDRRLSIPDGSPLVRIEFVKLGRPVKDPHRGHEHTRKQFVVPSRAPRTTPVERLQAVERRLEVHALMHFALFACAMALAVGVLWDVLPSRLQDGVSEAVGVLVTGVLVFIAGFARKRLRTNVLGSARRLLGDAAASAEGDSDGARKR